MHSRLSINVNPDNSSIRSASNQNTNTQTPPEIVHKTSTNDLFPNPPHKIVREGTTIENESRLLQSPINISNNDDPTTQTSESEQESYNNSDKQKISKQTKKHKKKSSKTESHNKKVQENCTPVLLNQESETSGEEQESFNSLDNQAIRNTQTKLTKSQRRRRRRALDSTSQEENRKVEKITEIEVKRKAKTKPKSVRNIENSTTEKDSSAQTISDLSSILVEENQCSTSFLEPVLETREPTPNIPEIATLSTISQIDLTTPEKINSTIHIDLVTPEKKETTTKPKTKNKIRLFLETKFKKQK